jgi:hypothetical protein
MTDMSWLEIWALISIVGTVIQYAVIGGFLVFLLILYNSTK